uniref:Uncharacterized protein n=1 Tax=Sphaerodactylus townsendi TaxID=933632 RepID=A0ACB8FZ26_9SAUR
MSLRRWFLDLPEAQTSPLLDSKVGDANAGEGGFLRVGRRRRTEKNTAEGPGACLETEKRRFFPAAADCPFTPCRVLWKLDYLCLQKKITT